MNLVQYNDRDGTRRVAIVEDHERLRTLAGSNTVYALATQAIHAGRSFTRVAPFMYFGSHHQHRD